MYIFFFFQAEDGIRDYKVTGVQTCALPISQLSQEVTQLQVYRQRYAELKSQMDALNKQLDTLKTIVPEEKEADEFIRLVQGAASASNVQLRRLTSLAIVSKEYHYEMPFEVQADGPYFNILDFFGRLSRLSR